MKWPTVKIVKSIYGIPYKTIKAVENKNGSVTVYVLKLFFLINNQYPWLVIDELSSMESFINKYFED